MNALRRLGLATLAVGSLFYASLSSAEQGRVSKPSIKVEHTGVLPAEGAVFADYLSNGQSVMVRKDGSKFIGAQLAVQFNAEVMKEFYAANPNFKVEGRSYSVPSSLGNLFADFNAVLTPVYVNPDKLGENVWQISVGDPSKLDGLVDALYSAKVVRIARPDPLLEKASTPNDPDLPQQYGIPQANIDKAWDVTTGSVKIGVVDSGVVQAHPDIAPNLADCVDISGSSFGCEDVDGHGTNVAGVAIARINNNNCVAGVAGTSSLVSVKITDNGGGAALLDAGIYRARDLGARVINVSYAISPAWLQSVQDVYNQGVVVVGGAGNNNTDAPRAPASMYEALGVGAIDSTGTRMSWSNWGPNVDLMAAGDGVFTTFIGGCGGTQGTSFSSPFVAGAAALVISHWLDQGLCSYTVDDVYVALLTTATPLGDPVYYGVGKLNGDPTNPVSPSTGFLSVAPSCKTTSAGNVLDKAGGLVPSLDVCYGDSVVIEGDGSLNDTRVFPDPTCLLQLRLMEGTGVTEVAPWGLSKNWSYGPVITNEVLTVQSKMGNEDSGCWSSASPVLLSLVPGSNVTSTSLGPASQSKCVGETLDLVVSNTQVSSSCFSCDVSNVVYAVFDSGSPVTAYSSPGAASPPAYSPVAPGAHMIQVAAKCSGEPDNRVKLSNPVTATMTPDITPVRVANLRMVKVGGSVDVTFDNQPGIFNYQLEGSVSSDPASYVFIKDMVADVGATTSDSVSTGLPAGSVVYMGVVGESPCTGSKGPE